jgi:regulatory protein
MRRRPLNPDKPAVFAKNKVMDLFARRDYSEKEVRTKLRESFKGTDLEAQQAQIDSAIEEAVMFAREKGWLGDAEVLAQKMAGRLHRRNKGIEYINGFLEDKGLPGIVNDHDLELEKALALVKNKVSDLSGLSSAEKRKEQVRIARFLAARGFDSETVRKVIYEKL